jgi:hypothetical protein
MAMAACAALAAGCASRLAAGARNAPRDFDVTASSNGLLIFSATVSGYVPGRFKYEIFKAPSSKGNAIPVVVNGDAVELDWLAGSPTVEQQGMGRLVALELSPGPYEVRGWVLTDEGRRVLYTSTRPIGVQFEISPGKATYIGNVHTDVQRVTSAGPPLSRTVLLDKRERDLPIAFRRYGTLKVDGIVIAVGAARPSDATTSLEDLRGLLPPQEQ